MIEVNNIQDYVIQRFRPFCIVFSSSLANSMCEINNLTAAELLRPFFDIRGELISFDKVIFKNCLINVFDSETFRETPTEQYEVRKKILNDNPPNIIIENVNYNMKIVNDAYDRRNKIGKYLLV